MHKLETKLHADGNRKVNAMTDYKISDDQVNQIAKALEVGVDDLIK
jgi:energy-converting hydrogenase A subunit M